MNHGDICVATEQDAPEILRLLEQLGYSLSPRDMATILKNYLETPCYRVFVAKKKCKVVGLTSLAGFHSFVYKGMIYRITSLVVDQTMRRQGVGKRLIRHAEQFAQDNQGQIIELLSGLRRAKDGTHDFYKRLGYHNEGETAKLYLRKDLS